MSSTRPFVRACAIALALGALLAPPPALAQAEPYLGQLMMTAAPYCPTGWTEASGQLLPISQFSALFSLIGTTYGGDGETFFALPDLRGRAPLHVGQGPGLTPRVQGEATGAESVTLLQSQMPAHAHTLLGTTGAANAASPTNAVLATKVRTTVYQAGGAPNTSLQGGSIAPAGASQPHENMPPVLVMRWCIALEGIFPMRPFAADGAPARAPQDAVGRRFPE